MPSSELGRGRTATPAVDSLSFTTSCSASRCRMTFAPGSSSSSRPSTCASPGTAASCEAPRSGTPRSSASFARVTTIAERREAWEASKTVGVEVADDVRELARLRNEAARGLGHRDWFALSLSTDELDEGKLVETLGEADRVTADPFARWKSRARREAREQVRLHGRRAPAVALRRSVLPGGAAGRRRRPRPVLRGAGHRGARRAAHSKESASRSTGSSSAATSFRATGRTSTRSVSTWIATET